MTDEEKVRQLRELLPATGAGIYLDTANRGPLSAETAAAMREADDWELRVGRVWEGRDEDVIQRHRRGTCRAGGTDRRRSRRDHDHAGPRRRSRAHRASDGGSAGADSASSATGNRRVALCVAQRRAAR